MKVTLAVLTISIASICNSLAGPSWGFTLNNGAGFYWNGNRPTQQFYYYQPQQHIQVFGPQYYKMSGAPCHMPVRNYSNAPIVVYPHCGNTATIVPHSWR